MLERQGMIKAWHDRRITPGSEWKEAIDAHLDTWSDPVAGQP
jgi:hypothetical protein